MLEETFGSRKPIIGMVHFRPLPGSPHYDADGQPAHHAVCGEVRLLITTTITTFTTQGKSCTSWPSWFRVGSFLTE